MERTKFSTEYWEEKTFEWNEPPRSQAVPVVKPAPALRRVMPPAAKTKQQEQQQPHPVQRAEPPKLARKPRAEAAPSTEAKLERIRSQSGGAIGDAIDSLSKAKRATQTPASDPEMPEAEAFRMEYESRLNDAQQQVLDAIEGEQAKLAEALEGIPPDRLPEKTTARQIAAKVMKDALSASPDPPIIAKMKKMYMIGGSEDGEQQ